MKTGLLLVIGIAVSLAACNGKDGEEPANTNSSANSNVSAVLAPPPPLIPSDPDPSHKTCNEYFPLVPGSLARYRIVYSSNLVANATVVTDLSQRDGRKVFVQREQIIDEGGGSFKHSETTREYACDDAGNIELLSEQGENKAEGLQNKTSTKFDGRAIVMATSSDLEPGRSWSYNFTRTFQQLTGPPVTPAAMTFRYNYRGEETVTAPAGKFKAVRLDWMVREKTGADYYARGIGLVRRQSDDGTYWELKEYSGLKPVE